MEMWETPLYRHGNCENCSDVHVSVCKKNIQVLTNEIFFVIEIKDQKELCHTQKTPSFLVMKVSRLMIAPGILPQRLSVSPAKHCTVLLSAQYCR